MFNEKAARLTRNGSRDCGELLCQHGNSSRPHQSCRIRFPSNADLIALHLSGFELQVLHNLPGSKLLLGVRARKALVRPNAKRAVELVMAVSLGI